MLLSKRECCRWFREDKEQLVAINVDDRMNVVSAGLLRIGKVRLEDRGKYLCWVNNSAGEETVQVTLTVTGKQQQTSHCKCIHSLLHVAYGAH